MSSDDSDSNGGTRRRFLGGTLGGAIAATLGGSAAAETGSAQEDLEFDCWRVHNLQYGTTVTFEDGSYISAADTSDGTLGSPGRVVTRVNDERGVTEVDQDCDPGELATTFTDSSVTVTASEEHALGTAEGAEVRLHYADGTVQEVLGTNETTGINPDHHRTALSTTYRGEGEHADKTIEAIEFDLMSYSTTTYLRNREVGEHLLGKRTPQERVVEVVGASEGAVEYEFTVDGPVEKLSLTDRIRAGDNDDVTDNGDGTWTVSGFTGYPGEGDAYVVNGEITSFTQTGGDGEYVVREHERRVVRSSLGDTDFVRIVGTEAGDVEYEFTVDGTVWKVTNIGTPLKADDNDDITDNGDGTWTVSGFTGNEGEGDTYVVAGDVTDFTRTGGNADFRITVDGREVDQTAFVDDY
ncbi:hypothetical protein [Halosimplex marinum]|uniref:hypothetical protein n=1 Tax=Halosimplex marinum TaxID=3396620 RepID=UPI003F5736D8